MLNVCRKQNQSMVLFLRNLSHIFILSCRFGHWIKSGKRKNGDQTISLPWTDGIFWVEDGDQTFSSSRVGLFSGKREMATKLYKGEFISIEIWSNNRMNDDSNQMSSFPNWETLMSINWFTNWSLSHKEFLIPCFSRLIPINLLFSLRDVRRCPRPRLLFQRTADWSVQIRYEWRIIQLFKVE